MTRIAESWAVVKASGNTECGLFNPRKLKCETLDRLIQLESFAVATVLKGPRRKVAAYTRVRNFDWRSSSLYFQRKLIRTEIEIRCSGIGEIHVQFRVFKSLLFHHPTVFAF